MKICNRCKTPKKYKEFNKNSKRCAECTRKLQRNHYRRNKESYKRKRKERRDIIRNFITDYKINSGCILCGENHQACLEFHHRNPDEKDFSICDIWFLGYPLKRIRNEIEKCDVLCANCHKKLHWEENEIFSTNFTGANGKGATHCR